MKKFFLFCISVLLLFAFLERENVSLLVANYTRNIAWYRGENQEVRLYDEARWLAKDGAYQESISLLSSLLNQHDLTRGADIFELYGDLLYRTRGATGDILTFYHRSRDIAMTTRIEKKIAFFSTSSSDTHMDSRTQNEGVPPVDQTGASMRESRRQELLDANLDRSESINLDASHPQDVITRTLDLLQTGTLIKDW